MSRKPRPGFTFTHRLPESPADGGLDVVRARYAWDTGMCDLLDGFGNFLRACGFAEEQWRGAVLELADEIREAEVRAAQNDAENEPEEKP